MLFTNFTRQGDLKRKIRHSEESHFCIHEIYNGVKSNLTERVLLNVKSFY